jgi:hypothetical protein
MLLNRGRLAIEPSVDEWRVRVLGLGLQELPLTGDIAIAAVRLPNPHGDPADRIIVAAALAGRCDAGDGQRSDPRMAGQADAAGCAAVGDSSPHHQHRRAFDAVGRQVL